mmetsp:Transcript_27555/g.65539  ORF Transcript_27555/g.65539 Transcript_27555/m.65539 type:complete len:96 (-) Transcript_27555:989-1276(-)
MSFLSRTKVYCLNFKFLGTCNRHANKSHFLLLLVSSITLFFVLLATSPLSLCPRNHFTHSFFRVSALCQRERISLIPFNGLGERQVFHLHKMMTS